MDYNELYDVLKIHFESLENSTEIEALNLSIEKIPFVSERADLLHGSSQTNCPIHHETSLSEKENIYASYGLPSIDVNDFDIDCNKNFDFYILKRLDVISAKECLIFFHGLNEKKWDKYLPWAYELAQKTGKAILLFPIAFHMNRAEPIWSNRHEMTQIANFRKKNFPENTHVSFVNAAISSRLEAHPQRIFWSGFQTYSDIIEVIKKIRRNKISSISADTNFDLFGYSIGSFLSMILKMADPEGVFKNSKLFCFCGGMTIDRMFPVSKYIMDSRAAIKMQSVFAELLSSEFKADIRLGHFQDEKLHPKESWFKMMLRYNYFQKERETRIKEIQDQIKVFVLKKDEVAPPIEALNTVKGGYRNIDVEVEIQDFDFEYSHITPFSLSNKNKKKVTSAFNSFIDSACRFYEK